MPQLISTRELWQVFWLETYCIPQKTIYERYVFRTKAQEDSTVDLFVTDVKRRAEYCEFGTLKDPKLRKRLLHETDLSLKKAIKLCQIEEQSKAFDSPTARANKVRFFFGGEGGGGSPKTDLLSQIIWILHYQKKRKIRKRIIYHYNDVYVPVLLEKGKIEGKNNKLILAANTIRKSNISCVWIYEMYIFRFETQTFLE